MSVNNKLEEIIKRAELADKWFVSGYTDYKVLEGKEFEEWLADIKAVIIDLKRNELTNSILKLTDSFGGRTDEKILDKLIAKLNALYKKIDNKNRNEPIILNEMRFVEFCRLLFSFYNIKFSNNYMDKEGYDFVLFSNSINYNVEIKTYRSSVATHSMIRRAASQLISYNQSAIFVLIVSSVVDSELRRKIENEYEVKIIDITNLLYLVQDDEYLSRMFNSIINDSKVDLMTIKAQEPASLLPLFRENKIKEIERTISYKEEAGDLIQKIVELRPGKRSAKKYEKICEDVLKYLFSEYLDGWEAQNPTDDGLYIMDLICRIKKGNDFWDMLKEDFHTRYILFEFKNYSEGIEQTQIYTTEKYLFKTALRNVSFIISRKGESKNAKKAMDGILRETGKLIISLSDNDLIKMIKLKNQGLLPEDHLIEKLDNILLHLSK